jgi:hypothetical protein
MPTKKETIKNELNISINGGNLNFYCNHCGLLLATGYTRVVIGDRGPYIEFDSKHMVKENMVLTNNYHVYFDEYQSKCDDKIFIYFQHKTVSYADYKIGKFYIGPDLVSVDNGNKRIICRDIAKGKMKNLF